MTIMAGAQTRVLRFSVSDGELEGDLRLGEPDRALVLFLHGWTLDRRMWAPQLASLSTRRALVAIDRRGFGRSTAPPDLLREADDVAAVLDFIGADKAVIVGMSQSGRVSVDFARRHPARLAAIVLQGARLGAAARETPHDEIPLARYAALARAGRIAEMKDLWRAHALTRAESAAAQTLIDKMLADYDGRDLMAAITPAPDFDVSALAEITVPALVLTGAKDTPHRRKVADALARAMPNAQRVEIEGAGHLCNLCAPDEFNAVLSSFLDRLAA